LARPINVTPYLLHCCYCPPRCGPPNFVAVPRRANSYLLPNQCSQCPASTLVPNTRADRQSSSACRCAMCGARRTARDRTPPHTHMYSLLPELDQQGGCNVRSLLGAAKRTQLVSVTPQPINTNSQLIMLESYYSKELTVVADTNTPPSEWPSNVRR
jgi:hypothetical protein